MYDEGTETMECFLQVSEGFESCKRLKGLSRFHTENLAATRQVFRSIEPYKLANLQNSLLGLRHFAIAHLIHATLRA
jgi:hypothetical protein